MNIINYFKKQICYRKVNYWLKECGVKPILQFVEGEAPFPTANIMTKVCSHRKNVKVILIDRGFFKFPELLDFCLLHEIGHYLRDPEITVEYIESLLAKEGNPNTNTLVLDQDDLEINADRFAVEHMGKDKAYKQFKTYLEKFYIPFAQRMAKHNELYAHALSFSKTRLETILSY